MRNGRLGLSGRIGDLLKTTCHWVDCPDCERPHWQFKPETSIGDGKGGQIIQAAIGWDPDGTRHTCQGG